MQWAKYNIVNTNNNTERFGVNGLHITIANTNNNTERFSVNGLHITKQIQTIIQNVLASMG